MFTKKQIIFLGLSEKEYKVFFNLIETPKSIFALSEKIKIPRATLYPIIEKLFSRGLIHSKSVGQRFVYQTISPSLLREKFLEIAETLKPVTPPVVEVKKTNIEETEKTKKSAGWLKSLFKK